MSQDEIDKRKAENLAKYGSGFDGLADEGDVDAVEVAATSEAELEAAEQEETKEAAEIQEGMYNWKLSVMELICIVHILTFEVFYTRK